MGSDAHFDPWLDRMNAAFDRFEKKLDKKFNQMMALIAFTWATQMLAILTVLKRH